MTVLQDAGAPDHTLADVAETLFVAEKWDVDEDHSGEEAAPLSALPVLDAVALDNLRFKREEAARHAVREACMCVRGVGLKYVRVFTHRKSSVPTQRGLK